ncbi:unnamed protein product [Symbiodinium sp. CCMP2592]|nr:unnamed protein product [Symbiodinium sp. CCMP2592]
MRQSQLVRESETVSFEQEVGGEGNEVELGKDVTFDLSGFDATMGDQKDLANTYKNAIQVRSTKIAEALGRLEATPVSERNNNINSLIEKLQNSIKKFDECYDKIDETYCDGAVEGYTTAMLDSLKDFYKKAKRTQRWTPGPTARKLVTSLAMGDTAANVVRFAKAIEEEQPLLLQGVAAFAKRRFKWMDVRDLLAGLRPYGDLADLFTSGIQDASGEVWFPIVIGMKGDSPALNKEGFHWGRRTCFPYGGWKAADSMMLMRWLLLLLRHGPVLPDGSGRSGRTWLQDPEKGEICRAIEDACCGCLRFFQILHKNGLWLSRSEAESAAASVELFCACYKHLAMEFFRMGKSLYHLEPSLHMFKHVQVRLVRILATGAQAIMSPAAHLTDMSEDFVGICSRISRRVAARTCGQRTMQRMLIRYHLEFEKLGM